MDWLTNGWAIVGFIVSVLGATFSGGGYWHRDDFKKRIRDETAMRFDTAKTLEAPKPWDMYLSALEGALDTLTSWMGKRAHIMPKDGGRGEWRRSAIWCFALAIIYPFIFLLISWLFGGTGTIGEAKFLPPPESLSDWLRTLLVLIFLGYCIGRYLLVQNKERINDATNIWLNKHLWHCIPEAYRRNAKTLLSICLGVIVFSVFYLGLGLPLAVALAFALGGAGALAGDGALALAGAGAGAGAVAVAFTIAGSGAIALAIVLALAGAVVLAIAGAGVLAEGTLANTFSATFILFFIVLPFANASFDWASWQVSRWLGDELLGISKDAETPTWWRALRYVGDMLIDCAFALACLIGLAWAIPRVISVFNGLVELLLEEQILAIADYLCAAATEPLGDGLWATSMLFSTLLPTAVHFTFLIFAPIFWGISMLFGAHRTNRARAAHLTHGTKPPKKDIRGGYSRAATQWPESMPPNYGAAGLSENQDMFEGPLHETTLHAITMQLKFRRPLYYTAALGLVLVAIIQFVPPLFATVTGPLPELLLWIANNGDWSTVQACFPDAPPAPPLHWLWS